MIGDGHVQEIHAICPVQELEDKTRILSSASAAADHAELMNRDLKAEHKQMDLQLQLKQASVSLLFCCAQQIPPCLYCS